MFWAISGFIFFWRYAKPIHARSVDGGKFFVWRLSRLYPLHVLTLGAVVLLQTLYLRNHDEPFVFPLEGLNLQLLFASNWTPFLPKTFNGPIWSVSVEVLVYALFFVVVRLMRPGLSACLGPCLLAIAFSLLPIAIYAIDLVHCAILFFAGGCCCLLIERLDSAARRKFFWLAVGAATLSFLLAFRNGLGDEHASSAAVMVFTLSTVAAFALIDNVLPLDLTPAARLGDLTYGSYLWHFPLQLALVLMTDALGLSRNVFFSPAPLILWLVATFVAAHLSHRLFERPFQESIRRAYRRMSPATAKAPLKP
jgi:peptidoglycan/LPS O-acetylase OafA/YrhL